MAFVSGRFNREISDTKPEKYIPKIVESRGEEALTTHIIPLDSYLYLIENYRLFLETRRRERGKPTRRLTVTIGERSPFTHTPVFTYNSTMVVQTVYPTQKTSKRTRIPMRTIRALANQIAREFNPDEVILFGSHAYGKPHEWSDVDLLVVMETPKGEVKTIMEISDSLPPLPFSVDIIARSRSVINKRTKSGDFFLREITKKGKVLYARSH